MRKLAAWMLAMLLFLTGTAPLAETMYACGDLNNDKTVDAVDALMVLQHAVGKITLSQQALAVANVSDSGEIDAVDALLILQYSVGKIKRLPADYSGYTQEEIYYLRRDAYYGVDGSDFTDQTKLTNIDDAKQVLNTLGSLPENSDIKGHDLNEEMNVIYTPISDQAKQQGELTRYNAAAKTKGTLRLEDGTTLTYEVPTKVTAYSAVPVKYSLQGGADTATVHVEATTWEEPSRLPTGMTEYYENTLPGETSLSVTYDGYVQAENADASKLASWSANIVDDVQGTQYPHYDTTSLVASGTIPTGKSTWLKFTFTNTGKTVLKGDGQGYFCIRPFLKKKSENGVYMQVATNDNYAYRLYDPLYPGESVSYWIKMSNGGYGSYSPGDYRIELEVQLANEKGAPEWTAMYVGGRGICTATFDFSASNEAAITKPNPVVTKPNLDGNNQEVRVVRNTWLGRYEEFQTSFNTHLFPQTDVAETGVLYVQPAPWNQTLTLRVISDKREQVKVLHLPLQIETESVSLTLNPYQQHYVVKEDGTREPVLATQNMADMRGNDQESPYPFETIVNDLLDMEQAGVNYLTSTMAFTYELGTSGFAQSSNRIMMDLASLMGFAFEGYGMYPYTNAINKTSITKGFAGVGKEIGLNRMAGVLNTWTYSRFGDMYWSTPSGETPVAQEDSRGWLTIDHDWRMDLDDAFVADYQVWLQEAYGSIDRLNQAYGSEYSDFHQIDPRNEGYLTDNYYNFTPIMEEVNVFYERSQAVKDMDLFRTIHRVRDYREILSTTNIPNAKTIARYEGSPLITAGLKATTKNTHYRETYYQMYRAALVGEIVGASQEIYATSTYQNTPFTPSETYELTKHAIQNGITVMNYHMHHRDQIYNTYYGDNKAVKNLHLSNPEMRVTSINTTAALFPVFKATYEAGGIPAVMWMDYYCNGFVTSSMYKELQFYSAKVEEMLQTPEGKAWATEFDASGSLANQNANHAWSYDPAYLQEKMATVVRWDKFNLYR